MLDERPCLRAPRNAVMKNLVIRCLVLSAPLLLLAACGDEEEGDSCGPSTSTYDFSAGSSDFNGMDGASFGETSLVLERQSFAAGSNGTATHSLTRNLTCGGNYELVVFHSASQGRDSVVTTVVLNGVEQELRVQEEGGNWTTRISGQMFDGVALEVDISTSSTDCATYNLQYAEVCIDEECEDESCGACSGGLDYDGDGYSDCRDADCMLFPGCDLDCGDRLEPNETLETATVFSQANGGGSQTLNASMSNVGGAAETDYYTVELCDTGSITWSLRYDDSLNDLPVGFRTEAGGVVRQGTSRPVNQDVWGIDETIEFSGQAGQLSEFRFGAGDTGAQRACIPYTLSAAVECD